MSRLPRFRCKAQRKMQWLEKHPWHIKHVLLARTLLSLTGTPRALGDVTDCPNLAIKKYAAVFRTLGDVIDRPKARPTLSEFPYAEPIVWLCSGHPAFTRAFGHLAMSLTVLSHIAKLAKRCDARTKCVI